MRWQLVSRVVNPFGSSPATQSIARSTPFPAVNSCRRAVRFSSTADHLISSDVAYDCFLLAPTDDINCLKMKLFG